MSENAVGPPSGESLAPNSEWSLPRLREEIAMRRLIAAAEEWIQKTKKSLLVSEETMGQKFLNFVILSFSSAQSRQLEEEHVSRSSAVDIGGGQNIGSQSGSRNETLRNRLAICTTLATQVLYNPFYFEHRYRI